MINSKFILDILDLILDEEKTKILRKQIDFLNVSKIEHTGIGMFINFENNFHETKLQNFSDQVLNGVEILNEKQNVLAAVILYVKNGKIEKLEIFNKNGFDFPQEYLDEYLITQTWIGSKGRIISNQAII